MKENQENQMSGSVFSDPTELLARKSVTTAQEDAMTAQERTDSKNSYDRVLKYWLEEQAVSANLRAERDSLLAALRSVISLIPQKQ